MPSIRNRVRDRIGKILERELKGAVPVRTGRLRRSIRYAGRGVIRAVDYGEHHIPPLIDDILEDVDVERIVLDELEREQFE